LNRVSRLSPTSLTFNTISISTIPLQGAHDALPSPGVKHT
jgi:hypothetical protein